MIELQIELLTASAFMHLKASEEFGRIGLLHKRDSCLAVYNDCTKQISDLNKLL
tara:strand:+ start:2410 stop:2571 length:162 start_codon:yes stop_codon:yes gene_type:complete